MIVKEIGTMNNELIKNVTYLIQVYSKYSAVPIEGLTWEFISYCAFRKTYGNCEWNVGSHKEGSDISVKINGKKINISVKTNRADGKKASISSYRTTRYKTLKEKIEFIKETNSSFNYYFLLLKNMTSQVVTYDIFLIPSNVFSCYDLNKWKEEEKTWIYEDDRFKAKITKSMSDQLWYYFNVDYIQPYFVTKVNVKCSEMGLGLLEMQNDILS